MHIDHEWLLHNPYLHHHTLHFVCINPQPILFP